MISVFDASGMLAYILEEPGGDYVGALLDEADVFAFAHGINFCEVGHQVARRRDFQFADDATADLKALGAREINTFDSEMWRHRAELIASARLGGRPLALGDAAGIARARRLDAEFVAADRAEIEPLH